MLFNIYTNDQPIGTAIRHFISADDLALTAQGKKFEENEEKLEKALKDLTIYYQNNRLKPNPSKTQVCAFHLKNRKAKRYLHINWNNEILQHSDNPKYLGVYLD